MARQLAVRLYWRLRSHGCGTAGSHAR